MARALIGEIDASYPPTLPTAAFELLSPENQTATGCTKEFAKKLEDDERGAALVGSVTLVCQPETVDLLRSVQSVDAIIDVRDPAALESFDLSLPTIRLPVVFDALESILAAP